MFNLFEKHHDNKEQLVPYNWHEYYTEQEYTYIKDVLRKSRMALLVNFNAISNS